MDLQQELFGVLEALTGARIEYAICGAFAVAIHGYPRLTRDIDLLIREADLDAARAAVATVGFSIEAGLIAFDEGQPTRTRLFRLTKAADGDHLMLDLFLVDAGFLREVWKGREQHRIGARTVAVVSRAGLASMKRAAGRPQDLQDLIALHLPVREP